ncbi:MAG TPA: glycosyltransferase family 4 protein, partial [Terriglobia bacterium]|nr:glycosyltransferase family 4 protein [Terriglobia bacterium]
KNCPPGTALLPTLQQSLHFAAQVDAKKKAWLAATVHEERAVERVSEGLDEALREGLLRGLTQPRRFLASAAAKEMRGAVSMDLWKDGAGEFKPFPVTPEASQKLTVCLLSSGYLPEKNGGIARFTHDLACGLAARGHVVHVLTASTTGRNSVGFENDVWVHRLAPAVQVAAPPSGIPVAQPIWRHSATMLRELHRIRTMRPIDLVEAPLWDAEGIAAVLDGSFRVVTWLQTPLKSWIETNLSLVNGSRAQQQFFQDQVAAETLVMERAGGIRACSQAIVNTIEESYGVALRHDRLAIIPLGMEDRSHGADLRRADDFVDILFTGRFERRKGIDVLFEAIPALCLRHPKVRFIMAGEEALMPGGLSLRERFRESLAAAPFRDRVVLAGKVSDEELERYLARCDIYVAPSRYESFGLVFLEAMMFGKPAIGCRAGGMPEVIEDGVTGLLAEPGDAGSLIAALERLIVDRALRQHLGEAARRRYLARYTRDHLIDRTLEFYRRVLGS